MLSLVRLMWRTARFELAAVVSVSLLASLAAFAVAGMLAGMTPAEACYDIARGGSIDAGDLDACPGVESFLSLRGDVGAPLSVILVMIPVATAVLFGSQLIAREIDLRTAQFSWWLEPSRTRWFIERLGVVLCVVLLASVGPVIASTSLAEASHPGIDISHSFGTYGSWGPIILVRGLAVLMMSIAVGAVVGRILPAVLLAGLIASAFYAGAGGAGLVGLQYEVVVAGESGDSGALHVEAAWRGSDGTIVSAAEAWRRAPSGLDASEIQDWVSEHYIPVSFMIPGRDMPVVALRETLVMGAVGVAAAVLALAVVRRRRPY